jgi:RimJ/RimL family protein N-acetyltransferase
VLAWRNAPAVRRRAKNSRAIGAIEHREWYARKMADPDCVLLIAELPGAPVGVLRYDLHQDEARVSIFLAPGLEGRGLGPRMLMRGSEWLREHHPRTRRLLAEILDDNERSAHAFACAGYVRDGDLYCKVL